MYFDIWHSYSLDEYSFYFSRVKAYHISGERSFTYSKSTELERLVSTSFSHF